MIGERMDYGIEHIFVQMGGCNVVGRANYDLASLP